MQSRVRMVPRYKSKDDEGGDDDGGGTAAAAVAAAELAPPPLCMVFKLPDEDECIDENPAPLSLLSPPRSCSATR